MTPIDSGSTLDQRIRTGIFLVMCAGMAAWFGYDGLIGYPAENLSWAIQKLPQRPADLKANPKATRKNLDQIAVGSTAEQIRQLLGEPSLELPRTLTFFGTEVTVAVSIDDQGKVISTKISPVNPAEKKDSAGLLVTKMRAEMVKEGITEGGVRDLLGVPASIQDHTLWYIGPAAYAEYRIDDHGKVTVRPDVQENEHRSESSILWQKAIAVCVALLAIYAFIKFWSAMRLRVVVDESGMIHNGRRISWDSMSGLKTDQYKDKAWVDLEYNEGASSRLLRLDSLVIQRFNEILQAICDRKGFPLPTRSSEEDDSDGSGLS
jgi:hypothetical protein